MAFWDNLTALSAKMNAIQNPGMSNLDKLETVIDAINATVAPVAQSVPFSWSTLKTRMGNLKTSLTNTIQTMRESPEAAKAGFRAAGKYFKSMTRGAKPGLLAVGILAGGFKAYEKTSNLLGAGYSTDSPLASWNAYQGLSQPINTTMNFSRLNWDTMQGGAQGNMAFALHNLRKG